MLAKRLDTGDIIGDVVGFVTVQHEVLAIIKRDNGILESELIRRIIVETEGEKHGTNGPIGMGIAHAGDKPSGHGQTSPNIKNKKR